ncbi:UvrD-helicase domain-containing protein [Latilactobacillus curvatus]
MTKSYLTDLNPEQLDAVTSIKGYVRVVAGAGSGKTKALTSRVAYLIDEVGIVPENILCVTFTNKAAKEMQQRVNKYLGERASGALIMTFGALEARIICEDGRVIGFPKNYQIIDEEDGKKMLNDIFSDWFLFRRFKYTDVAGFMSIFVAKKP